MTKYTQVSTDYSFYDRFERAYRLSNFTLIGKIIPMQGSILTEAPHAKFFLPRSELISFENLRNSPYTSEKHKAFIMKKLL